MLSHNDIQCIQGCVNDLEYVLKNWGLFAECNPYERVHLDVGDTAREVFDVEYGLCVNVFEPNDLPDHIKLCMFVAWDLFDGNPVYPVGGRDEYDTCNLYQNCRRKALALHCLDYLKYLLEL